MTEGVATQASGRGLMIAVWVVSGLLTALFLFAGIPKLMGNQQAVEGFRGMGYPDAFRLFIGAAEMSGAIGLWIPASPSGPRSASPSSWSARCTRTSGSPPPARPRTRASRS
jgi:hypothetical protein